MKQKYSTTPSIFIALVAVFALTTPNIRSQCPGTELSAGLLFPTGITQSNKRNLLIGERGAGVPGSGRISLLDLEGHRRTLLTGLPSGISDVGDPSGPMGVFMRGRTLYVTIGAGDVAIAGPLPGTAIVNPNGASSPIFSSVLAIHFSESVEERTEGFMLSAVDQQRLASREKVTLENSQRERLSIELVADFPDYSPNPLPAVPANVRLSNPFDLVVVDHQAYVTDGGGNMVRQIDLPTGAVSTLAAFPAMPNPFFNPAPPPPSIGGPFIEAVPTGIRYHDGRLLVTLFRGVPFAPGSSQVQVIDPETGAQAPLITGLKTAIDVIPITERNETHYLVLQHASTGFFFASPGLLLGYENAASIPTAFAGCLSRPTSMTLDERSSVIYVTEYAGRVVAIPLP